MVVRSDGSPREGEECMMGERELARLPALSDVEPRSCKAESSINAAETAVAEEGEGKGKLMLRWYGG